jgi:hypothetical protein
MSTACALPAASKREKAPKAAGRNVLTTVKDMARHLFFEDGGVKAQMREQSHALFWTNGRISSYSHNINFLKGIILFLFVYI